MIQEKNSNTEIQKSSLLIAVRHLFSLILLGHVCVGIALSSGIGCGVGGSSSSGTNGGNTNGPGTTGPIQDLGVLFNDELPGTVIKDGSTGSFITISSLGRSIIVLDTGTEGESIRIDNNLEFNSNQISDEASQ